MNRWLFHQNGFTRTSLSATVTRVSNFVEENVFFLFFYKAPLPVPPDAFSHSLPNRLKYYANRNALSMFKALKKGFKLKYAVLLLNHVEGRLKIT